MSKLVSTVHLGDFESHFQAESIAELLMRGVLGAANGWPPAKHGELASSIFVDEFNPAPYALDFFPDGMLDEIPIWERRLQGLHVLSFGVLCDEYGDSVYTEIYFTFTVGNPERLFAPSHLRAGRGARAEV